MGAARVLGVIAVAWLAGLGCQRASRQPQPRAVDATPATPVPAGTGPELGCRRGNADDCVTAGNGLWFLSSPTFDPERGVVFYRRACELEPRLHCTMLGTALREGSGVARDFAEAARLLQRSCDASDDFACTILGLMYEEGQGVPRDPARAVELHDAACREGRGHGAACTHLATALGEGVGTPVDLPRAEKLLRLLCDGQAAIPCGNLGRLLDKQGRRAEADIVFTLACTYGDRSGCGLLAEHREGGERRAWAERGCSGHADDAFSCAILGQVFRDGVGGPEDRTRALELFDHACTLGDAWSCRAAKKLRR